jgi:uncharacterized membrane protein
MADDKSISELMKEFVEELMLYLRQRGRESVSYVVVEPLSTAGIKVAMILVAAALMIIGAVFLGNFMVLGFAALCGGSALWGYLCSAVLVMVLAVVVLLVMSRVGQEDKTDDGQGQGSDGQRRRPAK